MILHTNAEGKVLCAYFAKCPNTADGYTKHSVLDKVPTCSTCAETMGIAMVFCEVVIEEDLGPRRMEANRETPGGVHNVEHNEIDTCKNQPSCEPKK